MSNEYSPGSSHRSRQGGRRRSSRNRGSSERGPQTHSKQPAKPQKKTLIQKIASFFGVSKPAVSTVAAPAAKTPARSAKPARSAEAAPKPAPKPQRKPQNIEVTTPRVYVGNLSFDATESDLQELFSGVGLVQNVEIVTNKHNQRSKGFGFVQLQTVDEAKRAVSELHDKEYMGRKLVVSGAKAAEERRAERSVQPEQ